MSLTISTKVSKIGLSRDFFWSLEGWNRNLKFDLSSNIASSWFFRTNSSLEARINYIECSISRFGVTPVNCKSSADPSDNFQFASSSGK